jgi:hypothetical protein
MHWDVGIHEGTPASATVDEQLEKAETLLQFTEKNLKPVEWCLMEAEVYLRSAREHLEVIETRMAPGRAPPRSPVKAVVGFLRAGERIEEHHGRAAGEERELALLLTGEATPGETSERCVRTRSRREDPQGAWSGASGNGRGAHRGSLEAGGDATGVGMSEMQAAQPRGKPTRRFRGTCRSH